MYHKTDLYSAYMKQFDDAVDKNEQIEAHLKKASLFSLEPIFLIHGVICSFNCFFLIFPNLWSDLFC